MDGSLEVYGPGCPKYQATLRAVRQAVQTLGLDATVTEIHDPKEIAQRRVIFTPAVRVNGDVKSTGHVPDVAEVTTWLVNAA